MTKKSRKDIDFDSVAIEQNDDILFITVAKYKLFLKHKDEGGLDAKALLDHYMFTARMQHTQSIKANDYYVMYGLRWGVRKLKRSKALLCKLGMIEYKQRRREDGTMGEHYIVLRMSGGSNFVPPVQETAPPVDPPSGDDNQMLKQENEMLKQENKVSRDIAFNTFWTLYDKKRNKTKCITLWAKVSPDNYNTIFEHVKRYIESTPEVAYRKDPERYIKYQCWNDDIITGKDVDKNEFGWCK